MEHERKQDMKQHYVVIISKFNWDEAKLATEAYTVDIPMDKDEDYILMKAPGIVRSIIPLFTELNLN